jgi:NET1-associated nuclear protein 1 (U3 small nucleolar RNA-associated protein 17)
VNVYSAASSFLIRRLQSKALLVQAQLSKVDPDIVYIATQDSCVEIWNWTSGQRLVSLPLGSAVYWFGVVSKDDENEQLFLVLENGDETDRQFAIASFDISSYEEQFEPDIVHLHAASAPLQFLSVVCGRRVIFAASTTKVFVGVSDGKDQSYQWNTFHFKAGVSSLDVRVEKRKSKNKGNQPDLCRLAIGSRQGSIFLYDDILGLLQQRGELGHSQLHWHREAVLSVKWSLDGVWNSSCISNLTV